MRQQNRRLERKGTHDDIDDRRPERGCVCFRCGVDVFPLPLSLCRSLPFRRGHPVVVMVTDAKTQHTRLQARLLCDACTFLVDGGQGEQAVSNLSGLPSLTAPCDV